MAELSNKVSELYTLEKLSMQNTVIHRLHPAAKMIATMVYIICIAHMDRYSLFKLAPFLFYPMVVMALAEIPFSAIWKRTVWALPFCLFAGISNVIFDKQMIRLTEHLVVRAGVVSLGTILLRTLLCVAAILILIASTPFTRLTNALLQIHVPMILVRLIEMIYRYLGILGDEAVSMVYAYQLRSPGDKWPKMKYAGSFLGQLFLRSMERAERIYHAMCCRGYGTGTYHSAKQKIGLMDVVHVILWAGSSIIFCFAI